MLYYNILIKIMIFTYDKFVSLFSPVLIKSILLYGGVFCNGRKEFSSTNRPFRCKGVLYLEN